MTKSKAHTAAYVEFTQASGIAQLVGASAIAPAKMHVLLHKRETAYEPGEALLSIVQLQHATIRNILEWTVEGHNYLIAVLGDCDWIEATRQSLYEQHPSELEEFVYIPHIVLSTMCPEGMANRSDIQSLKGLSITFNRYKATGVEDYLIAELCPESDPKTRRMVEALPLAPKTLKVHMSDALTQYITQLLGHEGHVAYLSTVTFQSSGMDTESQSGSEVEVYDSQGTALPLVHQRQLVYTPDPFWISFTEFSSRLMGRIQVSFQDFTSGDDHRFTLKTPSLDLGYLRKPTKPHLTKE